MENPIKMDDLGVLFLETPMFLWNLTESERYFMHVRSNELGTGQWRSIELGEEVAFMVRCQWWCDVNW